MDKRDLQVDCPCCRARLEVDVRTAKVIKWRPEAELDATGKPKVTEADWTAAADRVSRRQASAADAFEAHLDREKNRGRDLDDLFRKASEKLKDEDE